MDTASRFSSNLSRIMKIKEDNQVEDKEDNYYSGQPEPVQARVGHRDRPWRCRRRTSQEEEQAKHQQDHDRLNRKHQAQHEHEHQHFRIA